MNQNQINNNLSQMFDLNEQADEELVDILKNKERVFITANDLFLTVGDVQTILTLIDEE